MARGTKGNGTENQYEITLARVSAKLQVIKRADKQMKQREARGAASLRREQEQKEEDRRTEWPSGRELSNGRGMTRELISCVKQIFFEQPMANERTMGENALHEKRASNFLRSSIYDLISASGRS